MNEHSKGSALDVCHSHEPISDMPNFQELVLNINGKYRDFLSKFDKTVLTKFLKGGGNSTYKKCNFSCGKIGNWREIFGTIQILWDFMYPNIR